MTETENNDDVECIVCGKPIPDEYGKYDDQAPVYSDDGVYHLGCEGEVIEEVHYSVDDVLRKNGREEMSEHECPYDNEYCEIGSMCVQCCHDNDVYRRY